MTERAYYIVSDIHLGAVPAATERAFRGFLCHAASHASGLLINGDLFDFWFEYRTVVPARYYRVLAALAEVVEAGVPVAFVGGNHDAWGGRFLRDEVGLTLLDGPVEMRLGGRRALVAHGDGLGKGDLRYRALRRFIRHRWTVAAFRALHPDLGSRIALRASTTEEKAGNGHGEGRGRERFIEAWAVERLRADPALQLVVAGHSHRPALVELEPGRFYLNTGDWIHHFSYAVLPPDGSAPQLRTWPAGG